MKNAFRTISVGILLASVIALPAMGTTEDLRNDGATDGTTLGFQQGFTTGEIGAARLLPTIQCPCQLTSISFFFGPPVAGSEQTTVGIHVWDDSGLVDDPGQSLFDGEATITTSESAIQVVDLSQLNITVTGPFRVGIASPLAGLPNIARDTDGLAFPERNLIYADLFQGAGIFAWARSQLFGVDGDWVIRAQIINTSAPDAECNDGIDNDGDGKIDFPADPDCTSPLDATEYADSDGDLVPDSLDNCPYEPNPTQTDSGGINTAVPDGIGDACQCGDTNNDGKVTSTDSTVLKRALLGLSPYFSIAAMLPGLNKCNVGTTVVPGVAGCTTSDATVISRALLGLTPGIAQNCDAAAP